MHSYGSGESAAASKFLWYREVRDRVGLSQIFGFRLDQRADLRFGYEASDRSLAAVIENCMLREHMDPAAAGGLRQWQRSIATQPS